jgi:hypothetical protein
MSVIGSTTTTAAHIYQIKYSDKQVEEVAMREHPTLTRMSREGGFSGVSHVYAIDYAFPQGVSGTFADAQSGATDGAGMQLTMLRRPKFGVISLSGEAMAACENKGAFYDLLTKRTDRILMEMGDSFAFDLFRSGNGLRGRVASITSNTLTLTNANDVRNFKKGMTIIADNTITGLSPSVGSTFVTAIDPAGGTITVDDITDVTGSIVVNDYLFRKGDPGTCMEGFEVCTPLTAPVLASDSFRGQDRGVDVEGLSGVRIDDTSAGIVQNLGLIAVRANMRGKKLKEGVLNPLNFWTVSQLLGAKVQYDAGGTAEVGFEYIVINTPGVSMKIYSDPDCPIDRGRAWDPSAHCLKHLGELPHIIRDGKLLPAMRLTDADGIEIRGRGWVNYKQPDTAAHGVISI